MPGNAAPQTSNSTPNFSMEPFVPGTDWKRWLQRLEGAFKIFKVADDQSAAYLLHYIGTAAFDIVCDKCTPDNPYTKTYGDLKGILEKFYSPKPLEIAENYRFHQRNQEEGETLQSYAAALQKLTINCNFGDYRKTALRNQFVFGLRSNRIKCRLLEVEKLTFDKAVETAMSMELSEKDAQQLNGATTRQNQDGYTINYIAPKNKKRVTTPTPTTRNQSNKGSYKKKTEQAAPTLINVNCFRCGGPHLASKCQVAKSVKCNFCGAMGHFKRVCFKWKNRDRTSTHQVEVEEINQLEHENYRKKYLITLEVNKSDTKFELDTGSAVTVMYIDQFQEKFPSVTVNNTETKLLSYCNTQLKILGVAEVQVHYKDVNYKLNIYLTNTDKMPLLGREWIRKLKLSELVTDIQKSVPIDILEIETATYNEVQKLINKYKSITETEITKITDIQARLTLKPNATPVFIKARPVPFKIRTLVEAEIDKLVQNGVLEKVTSSQWATPIVPVLKNNGQLRICGDFKVTVNPSLVIDEHPLPTIDELFSSMSDGTKFSKIDLRQAYLQLEVREEDRELLTISTHKGLYRSTRLLYGIASAPAIWQREIENIVGDIPGVVVFLDDIRITGPDERTHLERLERVFERLQRYNIKINLDKCDFFQDEIKYCGYKIDASGIHKENTKMDAIEKMPRPENVSELRSFIGMINYYGKFIQNLSTLLYPLNKLLCKDAPFRWSAKCERAFKLAKQKFTSSTVLAHYDPKLPLILATDASSYGVGAVLSQLHPDGKERVLQYASQTLTETQKKYPQIDKEAYAIIFGIKKFHQYLYGNDFTLITDHQPLVQILSPTKQLPFYTAMRMLHYALFLQGFNYRIKYRKSKEHGNADALSRLPQSKTRDCEFDEIDALEIQAIEVLPVDVKEIAAETLKDEELTNVIIKLQGGVPLKNHETFNINQNEFGIQQNVLLRGSRVVIPKTLRKRILDELHSAHFGIVKTKALARGHCWWPHIDADIERLIKNCSHCQGNYKNPPKVETHVWESTSYAFQRVHFDFAGPFKNKYFGIIVDAYSKYPIVKILPDITTSTTIRFCRETFAMFGIPEIFVSDNGSQLCSEEFETFLRNNGIKHKKTAPFNPATNGQAEKFVQTLKDALNKLQLDKKDIESNLQKLLIHYRITQHCGTNVSPSELVFKKRIRSRLDCILPTELKQNFDINADKKARFLAIGNEVQCRNFQGKEKWAKGKVIKRLGKLHYLVQLFDGRQWKRHINQLLKVPINTNTDTNACTSRGGTKVSVSNEKETIPITSNVYYEPLTPGPPDVRELQPDRNNANVTQARIASPELQDTSLNDINENPDRGEGSKASQTIQHQYVETPKRTKERPVRTTRGNLPTRFLQ